MGAPLGAGLGGAGGAASRYGAGGLDAARHTSPFSRAPTSLLGGAGAGYPGTYSGPPSIGAPGIGGSRPAVPGVPGYAAPTPAAALPRPPTGAGAAAYGVAPAAPGAAGAYGAYGGLPVGERSRSPPVRATQPPLYDLPRRAADAPAAAGYRPTTAAAGLPSTAGVAYSAPGGGTPFAAASRPTYVPPAAAGKPAAPVRAADPYRGAALRPGMGVAGDVNVLQSRRFSPTDPDPLLHGHGGIPVATYEAGRRTSASSAYVPTETAAATGVWPSSPRTTGAAPVRYGAAVPVAYVRKDPVDPSKPPPAPMDPIPAEAYGAPAGGPGGVDRAARGREVDRILAEVEARRQARAGGAPAPGRAGSYEYSLERDESIPSPGAVRAPPPSGAPSRALSEPRQASQPPPRQQPAPPKVSDAPPKEAAKKKDDKKDEKPEGALYW